MQGYNSIRKKFSVSILFLILGVILEVTVSPSLHWTLSARAASYSEKSSSLLSPGNLQSDQTFVEISKADTPAVVNISTTRLVKNETGPNPFFEDPFFRRFFGEEFGRQFQQPKSHKEQSLGSGVIVESDGVIITNAHVVTNGEDIKVLLSDKREFKGKVIGTDPKTDLAVIKIPANNLPTIPWGDSSKMQVGEYVLAIGNSFGLNQTVTMGIISALGRANVGVSEYEDFIQTDAAINPGNSGGALVNVKGELIGINTAIFSRSGGYMGIGFAIPSNMAKPVLESIKKEGRVVRGWLGVGAQEMTPDLAKQFGVKEKTGALISEVTEKSPAEKGGIKIGDVIVQYQGKPVDNPFHLRNTVAETPAGTRVKMIVIRDKKEVPIEVTIEEQPETSGIIEQEEGKRKENKILSGMDVTDLTREIASQLGIPFREGHVIVTNVEPGSPADDAGVQQEDILLEINRIKIKNTTDYDRIMGEIKKGDTILLLIDRQGRTLFLTLTS